MAYPTGIKFQNVVTNDFVAIEDAMTSALTEPIDPELLDALEELTPFLSVFGPGWA